MKRRNFMSEKEHLDKIKRTSFKEFRFFEGTIKGFDHRLVMMINEQFSAIFKTFNTNLGLKKGSTALLRKLGKDFGLEISKRIGDKILDEKVGFEYMLLMLNKAGWFKYWHLTFNEDNISLEIHNTPEAYEENTPSCYYLQGILEGAGEHYFKEKMRTIEKQCISKGDPFCEFLIIKRKDYVKSDEYIPKRTELELILHDFDKTAKSKMCLILNQDGDVLVKRIQHEIDEDTLAILLSSILTASRSISNVSGKLTGDYIQTIINASEGTIMVMPVDEKAFLAAILDKHSSPNLIGIAIKQACDKISNTLP